MNNIIEINNYKAVVSFDPDIQMFRGEFIGLNGGADFYATDVETLYKEGEKSLNVFLDMCKEDGVSPKKPYSGRFNVRITPELHRSLAISAKAQQKSLNQYVAEQLSIQH